MIPEHQENIEILKRLKRCYPRARCSLDYRNHWELLVATVLSAQCTDERVNRITAVLFKRYPDPESMLSCSLGELEEIIHPLGLFRQKARTIKAAAEIVVKSYNGRVPGRRELLELIPGLGRKSANVILGVGFHIPAITVDTHVKRIARRLGLTELKDPLKIEGDLMRLFPEDEWTSLGHLFIAHGRSVCKARRPACNDCCLKDLCAYYLEAKL